MCQSHKPMSSARVCECGAFIPALPPAEKKIRRSSAPFERCPRYPAHILPGIPKYAPRADYTDDPGGSFDNARRAREDGRP